MLSGCFAQNTGKPWKLTQQEFLKLATADDTAEAVVKLFFKKRNQLFQSIQICVGAGMVSSGIIALSNHFREDQGYNNNLETVGYLGVLVSIVSAVPIISWSTIKYLRYNRLKLYTILSEYNEHGLLPKHVAKKLKRSLRKR